MAKQQPLSAQRSGLPSIVLDDEPTGLTQVTNVGVSTATAAPGSTHAGFAAGQADVEGAAAFSAAAHGNADGLASVRGIYLPSGAGFGNADGVADVSADVYVSGVGTGNADGVANVGAIGRIGYGSAAIAMAGI